MSANRPEPSVALELLGAVQRGCSIRRGLPSDHCQRQCSFARALRSSRFRCNGCFAPRVQSRPVRYARFAQPDDPRRALPVEQSHRRIALQFGSRSRSASAYLGANWTPSSARAGRVDRFDLDSTSATWTPAAGQPEGSATLGCLSRSGSGPSHARRLGQRRPLAPRPARGRPPVSRSSFHGPALVPIHVLLTATSSIDAAQVATIRLSLH